MEIIVINVVICNFNKECIKSYIYVCNVINKSLDVSQYGKYFENKRDVVQPK